MIPKTKLHQTLQDIHDVAGARGVADNDVIAVALVGVLTDIRDAIDQNTAAIILRGQQSKEIAGDFLKLISSAIGPQSAPAGELVSIISRLDALDLGFHNILDTLQEHAIGIAQLTQASGESPG